MSKRGTGGSGAEAFRREKGVPRGGPPGGTGEREGDVILVADPQLTTLLDLTHRQHYKAERGQHGEGSNRTGRDGESVVIRVPPGTVVRDAETGEFLGELLGAGEQLVVARGVGAVEGMPGSPPPPIRPPAGGSRGRRGKSGRWSWS